MIGSRLERIQANCTLVVQEYENSGDMMWSNVGRHTSAQISRRSSANEHVSRFGISIVLFQ